MNAPLSSSAPTLLAGPTLLERLFAATDHWAAANGGSRAKLGRVVVNDGGFFARLESAGASTTTATLEKFARFLGDAGNWPDGAVPGEVCAFIHVVGVTSAACAPSSDMPAADIGAPAAAEGAVTPDDGPSGRASALPAGSCPGGLAGRAGVAVSAAGRG